LVLDASCATPKATIDTMQWFIIAALGIICPKHRQFLDVEISNKSRHGRGKSFISRLLPTIFPANLRFCDFPAMFDY
jgi:hypothetical protein